MGSQHRLHLLLQSTPHPVPAVRLDRDGVGLGLYLVKSILDAHGEDIAVTSRDGETEFVFTLTLAKPAPKPTAKPENTGRRGGRKSS